MLDGLAPLQQSNSINFSGNVQSRSYNNSDKRREDVRIVALESDAEERMEIPHERLVPRVLFADCDDVIVRGNVEISSTKELP